MSAIVDVVDGASPLVLSMPHVGTMIPADISVALNDIGRAVPDTDWWIDRLYDFAAEHRPSIVAARLSRYVADVNRDPSGASLYPGQNTTGLCPTTNFDGLPIYCEDAVPAEAEVARRKRLYFMPYHDALARQVARARAMHGYCVLYDCHSIRSVVPHLFEGTLPALNIGTDDGRSCAPEIEAAAAQVAAASGYDHIVNGRFKGGWITRHYGRPDTGVHAIQMEIAQSAYMVEAPPWTYDAAKAAHLRASLRATLDAILLTAAHLARVTQ